jgi:hypothetical protein
MAACRSKFLQDGNDDADLLGARRRRVGDVEDDESDVVPISNIEQEEMSDNDLVRDVGRRCARRRWQLTSRRKKGG